MDLSQLQDGVRVVVQFSTRDNEAGDAPEYGPPTEVSLYVRRLDKDHVRRGKVIHKAGRIIGLTTRDREWAEYCEDDYCPMHNEFLSEEYRMKILEVKD